ncbi:Ig-like domain-containing protein [Streptomyces brevispora]|uniref:Ig-like domain-containing protein n=1 Tax=Streptomyces brevispora TaxID=887462 RepID=UPI0039A769BE
MGRQGRHHHRHRRRPRALACFGGSQHAHGDFRLRNVTVTVTVTVKVSGAGVADAQRFAPPVKVASPAGDATVGTSPTVSGTAEPDTEATVAAEGTTMCAATAGHDGAWTCTASTALNPGPYTLTRRCEGHHRHRRRRGDGAGDHGLTPLRPPLLLPDRPPPRVLPPVRTACPAAAPGSGGRRGRPSSGPR